MSECRRELQRSARDGTSKNEPLDVFRIQILIGQPPVAFEARAAVDVRIADKGASTCAHFVQKFQPLGNKCLTNALPLSLWRN